MKKIIFLIGIFLNGIGQILFAQSVSSDVIISAGRSDKTDKIQLDWTFGEIFSNVIVGTSGFSLAQGYQSVTCGADFLLKTEVRSISCFGLTNGALIIRQDSTSTGRPLIFTLGNRPPQTATAVIFDSLNKGEYDLVITDLDNCNKTFTKVVIEEPADFQIAVTLDLTLRKGDSTRLEAEGLGVKTFAWTPATGLSAANVANPMAFPTETTTYEVKGFTENGCVRSAKVIVTVVDEKAVQPAGVISPNGDGINDTWTIPNIDKFSDAKIEIFNRWGQRLLVFENYKNDWNGTYEGRPLPIGTYYYILTLPKENKVLSGDINILR